MIKLKNFHIILFKELRLMKKYSLPQTIGDDDSVNIKDFAQQLKSIQNQLDLQQHSTNSIQKYGSFPLQQLEKDKSKKVTIDTNQYILFQRDASTSRTQPDDTHLILSPKFFHSSRLKNCVTPKRRKKKQGLKDFITAQKVNGLKYTFIDKLKRNNIYSSPVQFQLKTGNQKISFLDSEGYQMKQTLEKIVSIVLLVNITASIFIYSMAIVFPNFSEDIEIRIIEAFGVLLFLCQIIVNLTTVRFSLGRKLQTLRQILQQYRKEGFYLDFANFLVCLLCLGIKSWPLLSFRMLVLLKFPDCLERLERLQVQIIQNYYYEQYWSLVKVLLFNFCFAHTLSIVLLQMAQISQENWMVKKDIFDAPWYQQYAWAYYWGTTVMLTVGFGDIVPVSYKEASCMVLIQTVSCVILAYNISCVGALISNIRSKDLLRGRNLKIFKRLADKHCIKDQLAEKINNFIEENANIRKKFNVDQQAEFVQNLPRAYRVDYLKEANRTAFQKLYFFNNIMQKTLFSLAQSIEAKVTHPQQILLSQQNYLNLLILKSGQAGLVSKTQNRYFSGLILDNIIVNKEDPFLLHTNFITKNRPNYIIKALIYSLIYSLPYESLITILRESNFDFELYCQLRDKSQHRLDQFQVIPCQHCRVKHTKFTCPRLHFIPIAQHVMAKYIAREKNDKNIRKYANRADLRSSCLPKYLEHSQIYQQRKNEEKQSSMQRNIKRQKYVIDQLKPLENQSQNEDLYSKQILAISQMQIKFMQNTTQLIKNYTSRAFGIDLGEDEIWSLSTDRLKNYRHYFPFGNSCNLEQRFDPSTRSHLRPDSQRQFSRKLMSQQTYKKRLPDCLTVGFDSRGEREI